MSLPSAVLPVQELWDRIISFLADSVSSLHSICLVARFLTPSAQSHLFRHITFEPPESDVDEADEYDKTAHCHNLCSILATSPHLKPFIRSVSVPLTSETIAPLAQIDLPNLRDVQFLCEEDAQLDDTVTGPAQALISLLSIRRVEIIFKSTPQSVQPFFLPTLFASCTPALTSLSFRCPDIAPVPSTDFTLPRPSITELHVEQSPQVMDWLVSGPFDLTQLQDIGVLDCMSTPFVSLLYGAKQSVRRLMLTPADIACLDLSQFSALKTLVIHSPTPEDDFADEAALSGIASPHPTLQRITVEVGVFYSEDAEDVLKRLDSALASCALPSLMELEVSVLPLEEEEAVEDVEVFVRDLFPRMSEKGVLRVTSA
ncbi:hypothetical protein C8J57DRAFT_1326283 [Mycena rebaudengoi]|nr:hypothetical protein C8J57DRAFT_1326283 [Mycena rebaudengoi]